MKQWKNILGLIIMGLFTWDVAALEGHANVNSQNRQQQLSPIRGGIVGKTTMRNAGIKVTDDGAELKEVKLSSDSQYSVWKMINKDLRSVKYEGCQVPTASANDSIPVTIDGNVVVVGTGGKGNGRSPGNSYAFKCNGEYSITDELTLYIKGVGFDKQQRDRDNVYFIAVGSSGIKDPFNKKIRKINKDYSTVQSIPVKIVFDCHGKAGELNLSNAIKICIDNLADNLPLNNRGKINFTSIIVRACTRGADSITLSDGRVFLERGLSVYGFEFNNKVIPNNHTPEELKIYHEQLVVRTDKQYDEPRRQLLEAMKSYFSAKNVDGIMGPADAGGKKPMSGLSYKYSEFPKLRKYLNFDVVLREYEQWHRNNDQ